jgi:hypothetical protein
LCAGCLAELVRGCPILYLARNCGTVERLHATELCVRKRCFQNPHTHRPNIRVNILSRVPGHRECLTAYVDEDIVVKGKSSGTGFAGALA